MPTVPTPLSELGILPLAAKAIKEFRARDEVRTLLSLVDADIRGSDLLTFGAADEVIERLHGLLVQPEIAGALARWIDIGDKRVHEPLERRLAQLLVFDGIDSKQLAALVVRSVERNVTRAKRSDREALLLESRLTRADIGELKGELADVASSMSAPASLTARPRYVAREIVELGPGETDAMSRDYCRQFVTDHGRDLSTQVPTAARVDEVDVEDVGLAARLLDGEAVVVWGPSGVGKTLMSDHAAVEVARSGGLPIWLEAAAYDGDFDALLGRSVAPFTTYPARELIQAASNAGMVVAVIVDGVNECPPTMRCDLLRQVGSIRLAHQTSVVISCQSRRSVPESRCYRERVRTHGGCCCSRQRSSPSTIPWTTRSRRSCSGEAGRQVRGV